MKLIFLHGLPGVGKLTVARELAKLTGFRLFHNHLVVDLVESIFDFGSLPFVELRETIWCQVFSHALAADLNGLIFTFAYDSSVRSSFIEDTVKVIESSGGEVLFVGLTCSREEQEKRIAHPSRRSFGKLNSVSQLRELEEVGAFVDPGIPTGGLVIDTTEISPPEAAHQIVSLLKLELA